PRARARPRAASGATTARRHWRSRPPPMARHEGRHRAVGPPRCPSTARRQADPGASAVSGYGDGRTGQGPPIAGMGGLAARARGGERAGEAQWNPLPGGGHGAYPVSASAREPIVLGGPGGLLRGSIFVMTPATIVAAGVSAASGGPGAASGLRRV